MTFDRNANVRAYRPRIVLNVEFRGLAAVQQAAVEIGRKVVNLAVDRF
jgi:hypothetical protein